jgi:hypothetical protein
VAASAASVENDPERSFTIHRGIKA